MRALYGLLIVLNGAGTKPEATFGLISKIVLIAVQIEGPGFSTRTSVGERPSERVSLGVLLVTGVSFETRTRLEGALDAIGVVWDAFLIGRVRIRSRLLCRQRCMNNSALLAPFIVGKLCMDLGP